MNNGMDSRVEITSPSRKSRFVANRLEEKIVNVKFGLPILRLLQMCLNACSPELQPVQKFHSVDSLLFWEWRCCHSYSCDCYRGISLFCNVRMMCRY